MMRDWERWNNPSPPRTRNFKLKTMLWRRLGKSRRSELACNRKSVCNLGYKVVVKIP